MYDIIVLFLLGRQEKWDISYGWRVGLELRGYAFEPWLEQKENIVEIKACYVGKKKNIGTGRGKVG